MKNPIEDLMEALNMTDPTDCVMNEYMQMIAVAHLATCTERPEEAELDRLLDKGRDDLIALIKSLGVEELDRASKLELLIRVHKRCLEILGAK